MTTHSGTVTTTSGDGVEQQLADARPDDEFVRRSSTRWTTAAHATYPSGIRVARDQDRDRGRRPAGRVAAACLAADRRRRARNRGSDHL